jgi:hypothetical protein
VCEAAITKKEFPSLLDKLWHQSFFPEHLASGFHATGIHLLNKNVINKEKLKPSIVYSSALSLEPLSATSVTKKMTSIFVGLFQANQASKVTSKDSKLQPNHYGEMMKQLVD